MRWKNMKFLAPDNGGNESPQDKIAAAAAKAVASVPNPTGDDEDSKAEDAKLELFARKVSDAVTKSIAELLNPSAKKEPLADDEEEVEEEGKKVRRKRNPVAHKPTPKKRPWSLFG